MIRGLRKKKGEENAIGKNDRKKNAILKKIVLFLRFWKKSYFFYELVASKERKKYKLRLTNMQNICKKKRSDRTLAKKMRCDRTLAKKMRFAEPSQKNAMWPNHRQKIAMWPNHRKKMRCSSSHFSNRIFLHIALSNRIFFTFLAHF